MPTQQQIDEQYMQRALALAKHGLGSVAPNPMVGAVIVCGEKIIGEGFHRKCGGPHAEVNAIASVKEPGLLPLSTLYVTLEPCSHFGKTPPCADLIISKKIRRVVVGCQDPFKEVAGRGIKRLREAGIEVVIGCLECECRSLIRSFITFHTLQRPYILLKWAQSSDGFIDRWRDSVADGDPVKLSSKIAAFYVHQLRSQVDAIMVGTRTALLDNPSLTTRLYSGKSPLRIAIDRAGKIPESSPLKDRSTDTLIFTEQVRESYGNLRYATLDFSTDIIPQLLSVLYKQNIQTLLVEGGAQLLRSFIENEQWDEVRVEKSSVLLGGGVQAPDFKSLPGKIVQAGTSSINYYFRKQA